MTSGSEMQRAATHAGAGEAIADEVDVLEHLPVALVVLEDGGVVWANRAACRLPVRAGCEHPLPEWSVDDVAAAVALPEGIPTLARGEVAPVVMEVATAGTLLRPEATAVGLGGGRVVVAMPSVEPDVSAAERRLEALLAHTDDIITVLDPDGTIRFSNPAAVRLTGLVGANGTNAFSLLHPDDQEAALHALEAVLRREPAEPIEVRLRFADGQWHHMAVSIADQLDDPWIAGFVVTLHDVTDRVRHSQDLAASERWLRSLVENLSDVVVVLDRDLRVRYASPGIEALIDAPAYTNVGEGAFNDMHPDDIERVANELISLMDRPGGTARLELRLNNQRLGWRWVDATVVNRLDDPAVEGLVCTLRDVTERKEAGVELQAAFDREREALTRLREVDRLKDEFLSTVSHELRTPLTSITGFAHLLSRDGVDEEMRAEIVERIAANAAEMQAMIEQLLDFSRLQAGTVTVEPEPLDLAQEVRGMLDRLGPQLAEHRVSVEVPELVVHADRNALAHVLRNLITNAARYSEAGTAIRIRAERDAGEVVVAVQDEGVGIAPQDQARIFQRFVQLTAGRGGSRRGTGVGLNVARRYVQLLGGRMWLESTLGEGSTFFFTLPLADPATA